MIGVDVGTGSARAGVFDGAGRCLGRAEQPIAAAPAAARPCRAQLGGHLAGASAGGPRRRWPAAGRRPAAIRGIGFDATCSLVVRDRAGRPRLGLDHRRARDGTPSSGSTTARSPRPRHARASGHRVLDHVGGVMSPEMEIPKLMWLKRHLPASLGARRPVLRPRRLPDLARQRQHRPLGMHAHLQVDLSRPRDAGPGSRTSSPRMGLADLLERGGLPRARHADRQRSRPADAPRPRRSSA